MTDLSPKAQAIVDAYENTTDKYDALAAVLRALNEYVVLPKYQYAEWELANAIHQEIEAVAKELENV